MTHRDLQALFDHLNARYFGGRLPRVPVRMILARGNGADGRCHAGVILLCAGLGAHELRTTLLHEMVHLKIGPGHYRPFTNELQRLLRLGASELFGDFAFYETMISIRRDAAKFRLHHPGVGRRGAWAVFRKNGSRARHKDEVYAVWRLRPQELRVLARSRRRCAAWPDYQSAQVKGGRN